MLYIRNITMNNFNADCAKWYNNASEGQRAAAIEIGFQVLNAYSEVKNTENIPQTPTLIGAIGEAKVYEMLHEDFNVENTSKTDKAGDMQLWAKLDKI